MWRVYEKGGKQYLFIDTPVETTYLIEEPRTDFRNLKAIMMDMDGSTTDTEKLVLEAMRRMMGEALCDSDFQFAEEDYANIIGDSTTNHVTWLINKYGLDMDKRDDYIADYYRKYHKTLYKIRDDKITGRLIEPMPFLKQFLLWAKQNSIKLGLVSSSLQKEVDIVMPEVFNQMGLDVPYKEFYEGVISADAVGEPFLKPHPNLYILMREMLGVRKEECIAIEDSTAGVAAARVSGVSVFAVPHRDTKAHNFTLANLGIIYEGLEQIHSEIKDLVK